MCLERTRRLTVALGGIVRVLILGAALAGKADCVSLMITQQPQSQIRLPNCRATFAVGVSGTAPYSFRWFRDGQPIEGATNSSYTTAPISLADNEMKIQASISNPCSEVISTEAVLIVVLDSFPPTLLRARGDASFNRVVVAFAAGGGCGSEGVPGLDPYTAQDPFNYEFSGGIIVSNAVLDSARNAVILTTSDQTPGILYTLSVEGVSDLAGNVMPNSQTTFQSWIVQPGSNPPTIVPPPVGIARSGTNIIVSWPQGSLLQEAPAISGSWTSLLYVPRPYSPSPPGTRRFYRALFDP